MTDVWDIKDDEVRKLWFHYDPPWPCVWCGDSPKLLRYWGRYIMIAECDNRLCKHRPGIDLPIGRVSLLIGAWNQVMVGDAMALLNNPKHWNT